MAGRGKTTFQKRQKEQKRLERRQDKAARKLERKALKDSPPVEGADELLVEGADGSPVDGADELLVEGADESLVANESQLPAPPHAE